MTPSEKIDELIQVARAATPGPWQTEAGMDLYVFNKNNETMIAEMRGAGADLSVDEQSMNATHITTFNPARMRKILEAYLGMMKALRTMADGPRPYTLLNFRQSARETLSAAEKALEME